MSGKYLQKGNVLLIILLVLVIGAFGFYFMSKGKISKSILLVFPTTVSPTIAPTPGDNITSDKVYLNIFSPTNGETIKTKNVTINGETMMNGEVFVNDKETKGDEDGYFSVDLTLDEGGNNIVITANDDQGNVTEQTLSVNVQTF